MYVTEDTTRADPDTLRALYSTAIRAGASRVCIADTVGHATPARRGGGRAVRRAAWSTSAAAASASTGTATAIATSRSINTLAALEAGATRLHGAALGIGERVGNTPMDLLLVNLVLMGYIERDLSALVRVLRGRVGGDRRADSRRTTRSSAATPSAPRPASTPRRSSRRSARRISELVDAVYSGVPASLVGREQADRGRPDVGQVERASSGWRSAGLPATRRARRSDLRQGEGGPRPC